MRCSQAHRLLSAYLDQELAAQEREAVASHLKQCLACAGEIQALVETRRLLSQAPRFTAPPGFCQRVLANLEPAAVHPWGTVLRQQLLPSLRRALWAPFALRCAEVVVILLMIGLGVLSGRLLTPTNSLSGPAAGVALLSLDLFDPVPPDSLGGAYLAMMEVDHEE